MSAFDAKRTWLPLNNLVQRGKGRSIHVRWLKDRTVGRSVAARHAIDRRGLRLRWIDLIRHCPIR